MRENKHTMSDLYQMQSLPLDAKIRMTEYRIKQWIDEYGEDGVYVSFSGGKDSTVLLDIVRNRLGYKNVPAVFVDVPTQYPELREFAKTWDNLVVLKPKISFMEVCKKYGFPIFSKEISETVDSSRKYVNSLTDRQTDRQTIPYSAQFADMLGIDRRVNKENEIYKNLKMGIIPSEELMKLPVRFRQLLGKMEHKENGKIIEGVYSEMYDKSKYLFMLDAPFEISNRCCQTMKKDPVHRYGKETGRKPMTAQMAEESKLRTSQWIKNGCNGFQMKSPISNPMSFWTEQDVLAYIKQYHIPICSVYGDIVVDYEAQGQLEGQMRFDDLDMTRFGVFDLERPMLKTTGCKRTGCMLCGFGCHLEQSPNRFEMLKETHPKMYALMDVCENNGVTFRQAIDWINEHGNMNIKY